MFWVSAVSATISLLQLNIEYGGTGVDFDAVIGAIEHTDAQVVALQEGCGNVPRVADALDWPYFDNRTQVVSRYPLLDPASPTAGVILVELEPGRVLAIVNVHPSSRRYGPIRLAKGDPPRQVRRRERRIRLRDLQPSLDATEALLGDGIPVVLLGDFNAPSHRDWTDTMVGTRPHVTQPFDWPTSLATEQIGLVDAYRSVHPDPVIHPGLTWPADRPFVKGYNPAADQHPEDRIDLMYISPDIAVTEMKIFGEESSAFSDVSFSPWPTDHRGLIASLEVAPAQPPPVVSVTRRLATVGDEVGVRAVCTGLDSIVVVPVGADAATVLLDLPVEAGVGTLATEFVGAGRFDVVARDADRGELARTRVWVAGPGDVLSVSTGQARYDAGEPLGVRWQWAPGNRADWVAVFARGADPATAKPLLATATGASVDGRTTFDSASHPRRWPLPAGEYTVHYLLDDLLVTLASADVVVS